MKKLLLIFLTLGPLSLPAQDGIAMWFDTDSIDTFISIYNSPFDTRIETVDVFTDEVQVGNLRAETFAIIVNSGALVIGETFVTISKTYILYDIYIDKVTYSDGKTYSATRHEKPTGPIDYSKY
jgi:hypothetical protein